MSQSGTNSGTHQAGLDVSLHAALDAFALDASFTTPARGVTALFGPSGAGKTSVLRAVAGLDRGVHGHVRLGAEAWQDGQRFRPPEQRRIGYVFQEASLFPHLDVAGNIDFGLVRGAGGSRARRDELVERLDLGGLLRRRVQTLSGGERQRVALTRALVTEPRLLLMDEPLAALDRARKDELLDYLESLVASLDIPVLFVSHDLDEVVRLADHLVLIDAGRVRAAGPLGETLLRSEALRHRGLDVSAALDGKVASLDEAWGLADVLVGETTLTVPDAALRPGQAVRLRVAARDVSIALEPPSGSSILNILPAEVTRRSDDGALALLELRLAGGERLLARVTRRSAESLGLAPGRRVHAQVKSVAVLP
jgi:molybdate transport system ATP-binding protein